MAEEKTKVVKKNIYQKLQQSRVDVQGEIKKKDGYNYKYFSNDNILPVANEVFNKNGLCPVFNLVQKNVVADTETKYIDGNEVCIEKTTSNYWGVLDIYDTESDDRITFNVPTCLANIKGVSAVQNYGGMVTFAKRYAYIVALELGTDDDSKIENSSDQVENQPTKEDVAPIQPVQIELIKQKASAEDLKGILEFYKVEKLEDMNVVQASDCISRLG